MPREKARKPRRLLRERGLRSGDVRSFTPFSIHRKTWYSNVTHIRGSVIAMQKARRRPADFPGIKFTIADSGLGKEIVGRVWSWGNPMAVVGNRSWTRRSLNFKKREERERKKGMNTNEKLVNNIFFVDNTCVNAYRCIWFYFSDSFLMFDVVIAFDRRWGKYGWVLGDVRRINCIFV